MTSDNEPQAEARLQPDVMIIVGGQELRHDHQALRLVSPFLLSLPSIRE
jgi:hypothetical protein